MLKYKNIKTLERFVFCKKIYFKEAMHIRAPNCNNSKVNEKQILSYFPKTFVSLKTSKKTHKKLNLKSVFAVLFRYFISSK